MQKRDASPGQCFYLHALQQRTRYPYLLRENHGCGECLMDPLKRLIELPGPSGDEWRVRDFIKKEISPHVDEVYKDKFGNLIAHCKGKGAKVMLVAHMDEIGLMVRNIEPTGISCSEIGGFEPVSLLGETVEVEAKGKFITGIITTKEMANDEPIKKAVKMSDLIIDTGFSKEELLKQGVEIGSYIHVHSRITTLRNGKLLVGKALDDRIGCYVLLEVAKRLKKRGSDIYYVFTVQEEIGLYGGETSVYGLEPDWAIAIDTTSTDDFSDQATRKIGHGPCLTIKDADMITNRCINDWFKAVAKKNNIPLQLDISDFGTTDALTISVSKGGIPCTVAGVAIRNIHTTVGIVSLHDIQYLIQLLEELLKQPAKKCIP
ncbi:M42 family peptidase [Candidatus Woesearchaeota archaeon]|nr:M42 family peptidase [Candidatus Woesearchaeota archaeon]